VVAVFQFSAGLITMGYLVAGLFFFRFWRRTGDCLFATFGCAFLLFALNQALVALSDLPREEASWFYLLRLAGFSLIIFAVVAKNARSLRRA
jgi:zinc transporter ZupT